MIRITVSDRNIVKNENALLPQHRANNSVACVEASVGAGAACIHHQATTIGKGHENRIALTNIDLRDMECAITVVAHACLRRRNNPDEQTAGGHERDVTNDSLFRQPMAVQRENHGRVIREDDTE